MPQFKTGDMWTVYTAADLFLISTNSTLKKSSHTLVMGRGIARQARDRFPGLAEALGQHLLNTCGSPSASLKTGLGEYGLPISPRWPDAKLGAFQVKYHYGQTVDLQLIQRSTAALCTWCANYPDALVHKISRRGLPNSLGRGMRLSGQRAARLAVARFPCCALLQAAV